MLRNKYSDELELLRQSLSGPFSLKAQERINILSQRDIHWPYFLEQAINSGVAPLLYRNLTKVKLLQECLPTDILKGLKRCYYATIAGNLVLDGQVNKITDYFGKSKIKLILLKGLALNRTVYREDFSRPIFADVDLLVKEENISRANDSLIALGYQSPLLSRDGLENLGYNPYLNSWFYFPSDTGYFPVHLHWHISNSSSSKAIYYPRIDMESLWREAVPLEGYDNVLILSARHQLIHLAEHALKHSYDKLMLLHDIKEMLVYYRNNLNWDKVIQEAEGFNLSRPLYYGLYFTREILGGAIPALVLDRLKPGKITFLEKRFIRAVLKRRIMIRLSEVVYLSMHKSKAGKIKFIFELFFASSLKIGQSQNTSVLTLGLAILKRIKWAFVYGLRLVWSLAV